MSDCRSESDLPAKPTGCRESSRESGSRPVPYRKVRPADGVCSSRLMADPKSLAAVFSVRIHIPMCCTATSLTKVIESCQTIRRNLTQSNVRAKIATKGRCAKVAWSLLSCEQDSRRKEAGVYHPSLTSPRAGKMNFRPARGTLYKSGEAMFRLYKSMSDSN